MTNIEHYFEVAKECGAVTLGDKEWKDGPRLVITGECLYTYTTRICAEKDAEIEHWKNAAYQADMMRIEQARQLSAANAAIAVKDEALKPFAELLQEHNEKGGDDKPIFAINDAMITLGNLRKVVSALSTSPESIAAWEAEKLEPLRKRIVELEEQIKK